MRMANTATADAPLPMARRNNCRPNDRADPGFFISYVRAISEETDVYQKCPDIRQNSPCYSLLSRKWLLTPTLANVMDS
jgi:hypothetical protein